jgi:hypothetical protein
VEKPYPRATETPNVSLLSLSLGLLSFSFYQRDAVCVADFFAVFDWRRIAELCWAARVALLAPAASSPPASCGSRLSRVLDIPSLRHAREVSLQRSSRVLAQLTAPPLPPPPPPPLPLAGHAATTTAACATHAAAHPCAAAEAEAEEGEEEEHSAASSSAESYGGRDPRSTARRRRRRDPLLAEALLSLSICPSSESDRESSRGTTPDLESPTLNNNNNNNNAKQQQQQQPKAHDDDRRVPAVALKTASGARITATGYYTGHHYYVDTTDRLTSAEKAELAALNPSWRKMIER